MSKILHAVFLAGCYAFVTSTVIAQTAAPEVARKIAAEAYICAYPMMESYNTWHRQAVDVNAPEYVGGFGTFRNYSEPYTAADHDIVTPNNDTPYSWASGTL